MELRNNIMSILFSQKEQPFNHTWQYWATRWWEWFLSIPKMRSPAIDITGERSSVEQSDPDVWFLASTINGSTVRTVKIPPGKALLFPIINVTISNSENSALKTDTDLISFVNQDIDDIVKKRAKIDGQDLTISEDYRVKSPPFNFSYPPDNIFGAKQGPTRVVGDGYWIFMRPLKPGNHTIETYGSCMSGKIQIGASIQLTIENTPSLHTNY
jgi:hypothetical protein